MTKLENISKVKEMISKNPNSAPEKVSRENFIKAKTNVSIMSITNEQDAFLYFASLNLLNTYVKQNKGSISYGFKQEVTSGFDSCIVNKIPNVTYCHDPKEGVLIINVSGMQFAFHNIVPSAKMDFTKNFAFSLDTKYYKNEKWQGIRLQPVAESLFGFASNLEGLSNESFVGNLKECQQAQVKADQSQSEPCPA